MKDETATGSTSPFSFLSIPEAPRKPRNRRWTILTDRALPLGLQADVLDINGDLIDYVKLTDYTGLLSRFSPSLLERKLHLYKSKGFRTFPGGISFEIAYLQKQVPQYFETVAKCGFNALEVSDDSMPELSITERAKLIKAGLSLGLDVFTEVGKKIVDAPYPVQRAIDSIRADLDAGAIKVTLENGELYYYCKKNDPGPITQIVNAIGLEHLVFEVGAPGWPDLSVWLLREFGPDINIENIEWDRIVTFEGLRHGLQRIVGYHYVASLQKTDAANAA